MWTSKKRLNWRREKTFMTKKMMVGEVKSAEELSAKDRLKLRYEDKKITQSQVLIEIAKLEVDEFFKSEYGIAATLTIHKQKRTYLIEDDLFEKWLVYQFYTLFNDSPTNKELKEALSTIKSFLEFENLPIKNIYYRVAEYKDKIYIDLGNEAYETIEISKDGFKVVSDSPINFFRNKTMRALPAPSTAGDISILKTIVNLNEQQFKLWTAFLFGCFNPKGPFPLLIVNGNAGAGKTFFTEITKSIVDPAFAPIRSLPKTEEDLMVIAQNNWLLAFDNLSGLSHQLSDSFCKMATGVGFSRRMLYTNTGESVMSAARPAILNGIETITERQDLADRSIVLNLSMITANMRKSKMDLLRLFEDNLPSILAFFCSATAVALRNLSTVNVNNAPRMADFAKWVIAAEEALGFSTGEFLTLYNLNIQEVAKDLIESDPIIYALMQIMSKQKHLSGPAMKLLPELKGILPLEYAEFVKWPAANKFSSHIARIQPILAMQNIHYEYKKTAKARVHIFKKL